MEDIQSLLREPEVKTSDVEVLTLKIVQDIDAEVWSRF